MMKNNRPSHVDTQVPLQQVQMNLISGTWKKEEKYDLDFLIGGLSGFFSQFAWFTAYKTWSNLRHDMRQRPKWIFGEKFQDVNFDLQTTLNITCGFVHFGFGSLAFDNIRQSSQDTGNRQCWGSSHCYKTTHLLSRQSLSCWLGIEK